MRVHYHLLTRNLFYSLLCFALLSLNGVAFAQVYKSYDADGNVIFSDKPTQRSQEVEITKPNLSDSFEIPPPPPPPAESPPETKPEAEPEPEPVTQPIADDDSADTNNDGRISRREKEEQRKERRKKKREKAKAAEE
jgi:type IV secretory pathway VirB10-like protein